MAMKSVIKRCLLCSFVASVLWTVVMLDPSLAEVYYSNCIGSRNTIKITDASGALSSSGAAITVAAWDAGGNPLSETGGAAALMLYNRGTTTISGTGLMARFPGGAPMSYEFAVGAT